MLLQLTRKRTSSEDDFLKELDSLGLIVITNYDALPYNYAVDWDDWGDPSHLAENSQHIASAEDPAQHLIQGADFTLIEAPVDQDFTGDVPTQGRFGVPYTTRFGRQWGVLFTTNASPANQPFNSVVPGQYDFTFNWDGNGVDYYMLDSGVDEDHPEFDEDLYGSRAESVYDAFYEVGDDDQNHGTHMASCGVGKTCGIATACRVISAKGLDGNNAGDGTALLAGMNALVARYNTEKNTSGRPGVMNNSWSSTSSTFYTTAVDAAVDAGMVMVASAGNNGSDLADVQVFPAEYNDVLSIGAMDLSFDRSSFSNYGANVDIYSPGRAILGAIRGGETGWFNGTSPAGGLMTALVCCLLQGYRAPTSRAEVEAIYTHVLNQGVSGIVRNLVNFADTTSSMISIGPGPSTTKDRIGTLTNQLTPVGNVVRQASVGLGITTVSDVGPAYLPIVPPVLSEDTEALSVALGTPVASSTASDLNIAPWLAENDGFQDADVSADKQVLCQVDNVTNVNDADGNALGPPSGRTGDFAFLGSSNGTDSRMYQMIPVRAVPDAQPVHLHDIFTNFDWETGDFTGWTETGAGTERLLTNSVTTLYPQTGTYMFLGTGGADCSINQIADISSSVDTDAIDAGDMLLAFECVIGSDVTADPNDQGQVRVLALDSLDAVLGTVYDTGAIGQTTPGWFDGLIQADLAIPANTRKLQVIVDGIYVVGTAVNAPIDSLHGVLYKRTGAGDRIVEAIDAGLARWETRYIARSFNIDSDDQGMAQLIFAPAAGPYGDLYQEGYTSTHQWTTRNHNVDIEPGTRAARIYMRMNRRAGTVINWYCRDITASVRIGQKARRLGSVSRMFTSSGQPTQSNSGGQTGVVSTISS